MDAPSGPLAGLTVAVTAERRSDEQVALLAKRGATVIHAPTMHTIDLSADDVLRAHTEELIAQPPDWTVATTGFGMRLWFGAADAWGCGDELVAAIASSRVVARGPKAQSACRQRDLEVVWRAPNESMPEVVDWIAAQPGIEDAAVAVQLFDPEDHPTSHQLRARVGALREIPIYRWEHPVDPGPAAALVDGIIGGTVDVVTFTSQPAVRYLVELAGDRAGELVAAFNDGRSHPVCIGPVCAEAGADAGITTMVWPEPFRLVPMVRLVEERFGAVAGDAVSR
jgi:uroporphyrinogen-III synthase